MQSNVEYESDKAFCVLPANINIKHGTIHIDRLQKRCYNNAIIDNGIII